jgi:hypothetical protein
MVERESPAELIDQVLREAGIRSTREREELRRELESHFAEAGATSESLHHSIDRFGSPASVGAELARTHRFSRFAMQLLRLAVALSASAGVAIVIQLIANLRVGSAYEAVALAPGFRRSALFSAMIVVALVAAWELDVESLCERLERHPVRMLGILCGLAATIVVVHAAENTILPSPGQAIAASAVVVVIWTCTVAILARTDRAFARVFAPNDK